MRKLTILFAFFSFSVLVKAQVFSGTLQVQNYGDHYCISVAQMPYNNKHPKPDSVSLRITVICPESGSYEVSNLPINGHVKYKLSGTIYIAAAAIWWKNGQKKGQSCMPTICGFFLNPILCFDKI